MKKFDTTPTSVSIPLTYVVAVYKNQCEGAIRNWCYTLLYNPAYVIGGGGVRYLWEYTIVIKLLMLQHTTASICLVYNDWLEAFRPLQIMFNRLDEL